jgi:hypothetical protein
MPTLLNKFKIDYVFFSKQKELKDDRLFLFLASLIFFGSGSGSDNFIANSINAKIIT